MSDIDEEYSEEETMDLLEELLGVYDDTYSLDDFFDSYDP